MIKHAVLACLFLFPSWLLSAQEAAPTQNESSVTGNTLTARFKLYLLIKGSLVKKPPYPEFAYRVSKAYPLKVREYLKKSKYIDFSPKDFAGKAGATIAGLNESGKKNAVAVAEEVFEYVSLSITASDEGFTPALTHQDCFAMPADVMNSGKGGNVEKCRLAAALLRYFLIPARMAFWDDHYVVQYFLKPLETEKVQMDWHIMDFTGAYDKSPGKIEPVEWHPVRAQELLGEEWENENLAVKVISVKNTRMEINEAEALALFTNIERGIEPDTPGNTALANYFLLKEIDYEMTMPGGSKTINMEFTLPFNESKEEPFKTVEYEYYIKTGEGLKAALKRTHTMVNPPNNGLVYTLPVEFTLEAK